MWCRWKKPKTRWRKLRQLGISATETRIATGTAKRGRSSDWGGCPRNRGNFNEAPRVRCTSLG